MPTKRKVSEKSKKENENLHPMDTIRSATQNSSNAEIISILKKIKNGDVDTDLFSNNLSKKYGEMMATDEIYELEKFNKAIAFEIERCMNFIHHICQGTTKLNVINNNADNILKFIVEVVQKMMWKEQTNEARVHYFS